MRKSQEINKAIAILRKKGDKTSLNQADVLSGRHSEVWVFEHYVQRAEPSSAMSMLRRLGRPTAFSSCSTTANW